jgi:hypothetical protein
LGLKSKKLKVGEHSAKLSKSTLRIEIKPVASRTLYHKQKCEDYTMPTEEKAKSVRIGLLARIKASGSRVPDNHLLYERMLPTLIMILATIMGGLILFAAGVLLGLIPFS